MIIIFLQAAQIWCGDWSWIQDTAQLVQRIVLHRVLVGRRRDSAGRHVTHTQPALFLWLRRMLSADNLAHVSFILFISCERITQYFVNIMSLLIDYYLFTGTERCARRPAAAAARAAA